MAVAAVSLGRWIQRLPGSFVGAAARMVAAFVGGRCLPLSIRAWRANAVARRTIPDAALLSSPSIYLHHNCSHPALTLHARSLGLTI